MKLSQAYETRLMHEADLAVLGRIATSQPINLMQVEFRVQAESKRLEHLGKLGPPPPSDWRNLNELDQVVTELLAAGRAESVADLLERAYPPERAPWEIIDRIATLRLHLGEPERARALWQQAAAVPEPALAMARIGATYFVENNFEAARGAYRQALEAQPNLFEACYSLAVLEQDAGDAPAAHAMATKAIAIAPGDAARDAARRIAGAVERFVKDEPGRPSVRRAAGSGDALGAGLRRRQDVVHGNLAQRLASDHDGHGLPLRVNLARTVTLRSRVGKDLDLAMDQVDDPVDRDPTAGVSHPLLAPVLIEGSEGHLGQESHVLGARDPVRVILGGPPDDRDVRLRLVIVGDADRLLRAPGPTGTDDVSQPIEEFPGGIAMLRALCHLVHHVAVQEFDPVGILEGSRQDDPLILIDGDAVHRPGWEVRRDHRRRRRDRRHGEAPQTEVLAARAGFSRAAFQSS
jgi:tetratricopeptide (TPR) repeat protein